MTVRELQELLESYDPATQVVIQGDKKPYFAFHSDLKIELVQAYKSNVVKSCCF